MQPTSTRPQLIKKARPTRRQFIERAGQVAAATFLAGCTPSRTVPKVGNFVDQLVLPELVVDTSPSLPSLPNPITPVLGGVSKSLDVQIGQMILAGFNGQQLSQGSAIIQDVAQSRIGSVALFGRNVVNIEQVKELTAALQQVADIPLLVSVDQEGGQVRRLGNNFGLRTNYSAAQLGRLNDISATSGFAELTAKTLSQVGINLNLAPVVDLNVNPSNPVIGSQGRSFSHDPQVVTDQALAFIKAHHQEGIFCTLKHFPGHGSSTADSHLGFVDVTETWSEDELAPFEAIIRSGSCDAIMTAHIYNTNLDSEHPATLSKATITGILRQKLNYQGVIMTDDIQMGAIRNFYEFNQAIELALDAGVDVFAISRYSPILVDRVFATIHELIASGKVSQERIYSSYQRVIALKSRLVATQPMTTQTENPAPSGATAAPPQISNPPSSQLSNDSLSEIPEPVEVPIDLEKLDKFLH